MLLLFAFCLSFAGCDSNPLPFSHALKSGRYKTDTSFTLGELNISQFQIELQKGDIGQYVKTDGNTMIKDRFTVNEHIYTVYRVNLTMNINGETEQFRFQSAKALNRKTTTEYKVSGIAPWYYGTDKSYPELDSFVMTTVDSDADGIAEKLNIKINEVELELENSDILYHFTLQDDEGVFGTIGTLDLTYFDYQTVILCDYDVSHFVYESNSFDYYYRMPVISLSDGQVLTPVLVKPNESNSVDYWRISFPMPSHDISGKVSQIDVPDADVTVSEFHNP